MPDYNMNSLRHDPRLGEVDPRTYPLIASVCFRTRQRGTHSRRQEINRLTRVIDRLATEWAEEQGQEHIEIRTHYTAHPDKSPVDVVEVRVQPMNLAVKQEPLLAEYLRSRADEIAKAGKDPKWGGWQVLAD